jgi:hypothetical protein
VYNSVNSLYHEVINSLQQGIAVIDTDGYIIATNHVWNHLLIQNENPSEFDWHGINFFHPHDYLSPMQQNHHILTDSLLCILKGHQYSYSYEFNWPINDRHWFLFNACPLLEQGVDRIKGIVISILDISNKKQLELDLLESISQIRTLRGFLPICAVCKSIRDEEELWKSVETFLEKHTHVEFTHDICPDCIRRLYPKYSSVLERPPES